MGECSILSIVPLPLLLILLSPWRRLDLLISLLTTSIPIIHLILLWCWLCVLNQLLLSQNTPLILSRRSHVKIDRPIRWMMILVGPINVDNTDAIIRVLDRWSAAYSGCLLNLVAGPIELWPEVDGWGQGVTNRHFSLLWNRWNRPVSLLLHY